jgi:hypothetical protein
VNCPLGTYGEDLSHVGFTDVSPWLRSLAEPRRRAGRRGPEVVAVDVSLRGIPRLRALAAINGQPSDEPPGVAATLQRLCRAVARDLGLAGPR